MSAPTVFRFGETFVSSEVPLTELDEASRAEATVHVCRGDVTPPDVWLRSWQRRDGVTSHRLGRRQDCYLVDFAGAVLCEINGSLDRVLVDTRGRAPELARLIVHQLLPLLFAQRGALLLHASAVAMDGGAIAFFGGSAAGKSTLAATLVAGGAGLVSDDALWIENTAGRHTGHGTFPGLWLAPASRQALDLELDQTSSDGKVHVLRDRMTLGPTPLRALIWLDDIDDPDDTAIETLPMVQADVYFALYDHLFQLDPSDRQVARSVFQGLTEIARCVPAWRLKAPYQFEHLSVAIELVQAIAREVSEAAIRP